LLEGKNVDLRIWEKEDLKLVAEWINNSDFFGEFMELMQVSRTEEEKFHDTLSPETKFFFIEKKDGSKVGTIWHYQERNLPEMGYALVPSERGKGYCSEAVMIMVDYLFLSKNIERIQAQTDVRNVGSQKVLEKAGFRKEGIIRKVFFLRGQLRDACLYRILREEWKEPSARTRTIWFCGIGGLQCTSPLFQKLLRRTLPLCEHQHKVCRI
jgi:RimJ/RimL family protein N-acetyltransferase